VCVCVFCIVSVVLRIQPRAWHMLGNHSTTEVRLLVIWSLLGHLFRLKDFQKLSLTVLG
jgi:hypothetical protein